MNKEFLCCLKNIKTFLEKNMKAKSFSHFLTARDNDENTLLNLAIQSGNVEVAKYLLDAGAPWTDDITKENILHVCARYLPFSSSNI